MSRCNDRGKTSSKPTGKIMSGSSLRCGGWGYLMVMWGVLCINPMALKSHEWVPPKNNAQDIRHKNAHSQLV